MQIIDLGPGVKIYLSENLSILFGCPPEIIKAIIQRNLPFPDYVVLPDTVHYKGVVQNATEFVFYYHVFVLGGYARGRKLHILGEPSQVASNQELLRLTLFGPDQKDYQELAPLGGNPYFLENLKESRAIALKDNDGEILPVTEFVHFLSFANGVLQTELFELTHLDRNVYQLNGATIDINFAEEQLPPYDLRPDLVPLRPSKFGINVLGGASGFSPDKPCSGLILNYNSQYMLLDCVPYLEQSLKARGISRNQVNSIFLSHIHDDHCNILPLVLYHDRIKFLTTREIFWMACKKLALTTGHSWKEFYSYFDFFELEPYRPNSFFGLEITPHYTVHSIPCIGATFRLNCDGISRSIVFVGDNKSVPEIRKMVDNGAVTEKKYQTIHRLYQDRHDLFIADGGMGILHGDPQDSLKSQSDRVVFLHMDSLPQIFNATFSSAVHGKRFTIQKGSETAYILQAVHILTRHYQGIPHEWLTVLLNNIRILQYNAGDVILKQGEAANTNTYIIFSGNIHILYHDGKTHHLLSVNQAGDLVGEMATINQVDHRSASLVAGTPVTLGEINGESLYAFLTSTNKLDHIKEILKIRFILEKLFYNFGLSVIGNQRIAEAAELLNVKKNEIVIRPGDTAKHFFLIISGSFMVRNADGELAHLEPRDFFGELIDGAKKPRTSTVTALTDGQVLRLQRQECIAIIQSTPALYFYINQRILDGTADFLGIGISA